MADKIVITELDIDIDALTKKNAELLGQLTALKENQKGLKKETDNLNNANEDQLKTYVKTDTQIKKLNTEYNQQKTILAETTTGVNNLSTALNKEIKTVREAQTNNSKLVKLRNQLNTKTKEGQVAIKQVNEKMAQNNSVIKANVSNLEKQRINIGNYTSALDKVVPGLGGFIDGLTGVGGGLKSSTTGLKRFKVALISTGIGAIVVALGLLVSGFLSTEAGTNKVTRIMTQFGSVVEVLLGRVGRLANGLLSFLTGDVKGGLAEMKGAFEGINEAIKKTIKSAGELADMKILNDNLRRSTNAIISGLETIIAVNEQVRDDSTRSFKEREAASRQLVIAETEIAAQRVSLVKRELQETLAKNKTIREGGSKLTKAQKDEAVERGVAVQQAITEQKRIELTNEKERRTLVQDRLEKDLDILIDGFDNQKTINERKLADERYTAEEKNAILEETIKLSDDSLAKQVETLQEFTNKRIDINDLLATSDAVLLNKKIRAYGLSEIIEGRLLEVVRDRRTAEADLAEQAILLLEKELKAEADAERQREEARAASEARQLESEDRIAKKIATGKAILFEEEIIRLEEEGATRLAIRLAELNEEGRLEKEKIDQSVEDEKIKQRRITLLEKEYSKVRTQIKREEEMVKLSLIGDIAGQAANVFGRETVLGKAAAIAQATINTYKGATLALATLPPPFGAISAGLTVAAGLKSVAKITGISLPKFAKGTKRIKGPGTPTSDSILAWNSKDERVVDAKNNRKIGFDMPNDQLATAAQMYRSFKLNGGNVSYNSSGIIGAINDNTETLKKKRASQTNVHVSENLRVVNESIYLT